MAAKYKLDWAKWNTYVNDLTQCTLLSHEEEIKFLSGKDEGCESSHAHLALLHDSSPQSRRVAYVDPPLTFEHLVAQYLKKHPEKAHELMIPSGFQQCRLRRLERYLGGEQPISEQNGFLDEGMRRSKVFDTFLPGSPKVVSNPGHIKPPSWREFNSFVCQTGNCENDAEEIAPQYMYPDSGEGVHIIKYKGMEIEVTFEQWQLMWTHVVCPFTGPNDPKKLEFCNLHSTLASMEELDPRLSDWKFPGGQQVAIIKKQLEHRLRAAHKVCPDLGGNSCCPWKSPKDPAGKEYKEFLTKEEAAELVIDERLNRKEKLKCYYDPVVYNVLKKRGVKVPSDYLKWSTAKDLDAAIAKSNRDKRELTKEQLIQLASKIDPTGCLLHKAKDCECSDTQSNQEAVIERMLAVAGAMEIDPTKCYHCLKNDCECSDTESNREGVIEGMMKLLSHHVGMECSEADWESAASADVE